MFGVIRERTTFFSQMILRMQSFFVFYVTAMYKYILIEEWDKKTEIKKGSTVK